MQLGRINAQKISAAKFAFVSIKAKGKKLKLCDVFV